MSNHEMLHGISTVIFFASDLDAAAKWYSDLLGVQPYFSVPGYIEFRIGDLQQELGIIDSRYVPNTGSAGGTGAMVYWHVSNLKQTLERLTSLGARVHAAITDRGNGFQTASVVDPFGNILGIMYNPHYVKVVESLNIASKA